jgi:uncharacterized protein (DUF305 family)
VERDKHPDVYLTVALSIGGISAALLVLSVATLSGQQEKPAAGGAPMVQPGAPGQSGKTLTPATAGTPVRGPSGADTSFVQGMIMHHSQAVEMVALLRTRAARDAGRRTAYMLPEQKSQIHRTARRWRPTAPASSS